MVWSLSQAQDQLEELIQRAIDEEPQIISVDGQETAVIVSKGYYDHLCVTPRPLGFKDFLKAASTPGGLDHSRDGPLDRDIET